MFLLIVLCFWLFGVHCFGVYFCSIHSSVDHITWFITLGRFLLAWSMPWWINHWLLTRNHFQLISKVVLNVCFLKLPLFCLHHLPFFATLSNAIKAILDFLSDLFWKFSCSEFLLWICFKFLTREITFKNLPICVYLIFFQLPIA